MAALAADPYALSTVAALHAALCVAVLDTSRPGGCPEPERHRAWLAERLRVLVPRYETS